MLKKQLLSIFSLTVVLCGAAILNSPAVHAQRSEIAPGEIIISEFRQSGPAGDQDEYVELFNTTNETLNVRRLAIAFARNSAETPFDRLTLFPATPGTIAPRSYYLIANRNPDSQTNRYSLDGHALPDYESNTIFRADTFAETSGLALVLFDETLDNVAAEIDSVGYNNQPQPSGSVFRFGEGTLLDRPTLPTPRPQYAFLRRNIRGFPQDTNNNAADFILVSNTESISQPDGTPQNIVGILGAPDPQSQNSPRIREPFGSASIALFDPSVGTFQQPNNVVNLSDFPLTGSRGSLILRRRVTNSSGRAVTQLRVHILELTTYSPSNPGQPDLRLVSSQGSVAVRNGQNVQTSGLTLDIPPGSQTQGGGINSTARVATINLNQPLGATAPNNTIDIDVKFAIQTRGVVSYVYAVETVNATAQANSTTTEAKSSVTSTTATTSAAPSATKAKRGSRRASN